MLGIQDNEDLEEELGEHQVDVADQHAEMIELESQESLKSRGRPKIPEQWTKVISLNDSKQQPINTYEIATDLMMIPQREGVPLGRTETPWDPLFFPKDYCKSQPNEGLEECRLTEKQLLNLGKDVTKHRQ